MKLCILFSLLASLTRGEDSISDDDFKKLPSAKQLLLIDRSPPEARDRLTKIRNRLLLIDKYGGEQGWKRHQEDRVIEGRGLGYLGYFFKSLRQAFPRYEAMMFSKNSKMSSPRQEEMQRHFDEEKKSLEVRFDDVVHPLLARLAPSAEALQLAKEVESITNDMRNRYWLDGTGPSVDSPSFKREWDALTKFADQLVEKLKTLPRLRPEQVESEINTLSTEFPHR